MSIVVKIAAATSRCQASYWLILLPIDCWWADANRYIRLPTLHRQCFR